MRLKLMVAIVLGLLSSQEALARGKKAKIKVADPVVTPVPAPLPENLLDLDLSNGGHVVIQLRPDKAPQSVARIKLLARRGFYNGLIFHRVIEGFMAQGGDPKGDGTGGSELPDLQAEFNDMPHVRGTMSMARAAEPNSANSQFFIMLMPNLGLDGHYSPVGRVISGMEAVDAIAVGEPPADPTKIVRAWIEGEDTTPPPAAPEAAPPPAAAPEAAAPATPPAPPTLEAAPVDDTVPPAAPAPAPEAAPAQ